MFTKIIFALAFFLSIGNVSVSQDLNLIIEGNQTVVEGGEETYYISYNTEISPNALNFQLENLVNGIVTQTQLDPNEDLLFVKILWNCGASVGSFRIRQGSAFVDK